MSEIIKIDDNHIAIKELKRKDKRLAKLISMIGEISYQTYDDEYQFIIHEIIEQMLSIKASHKIFERLVILCDGNINPESINQLSKEQLKSIGTSHNKIEYIKIFTETIICNPSFLYDLRNCSDQEVIKRLTQIKGIGNWTAKMYLIFVLNRFDILPTEDVAFLQSYKWLYNTEDTSKETVEKKCKKWKPYSSIAARYMYRALDTGLTRDKFHLFK